MNSVVDLHPLREFSKNFIGLVGPGSEYNSYIYLDFERQAFISYNNVMGRSFRVSFSEHVEPMPSFYVDARKLLRLANICPSHVKIDSERAFIPVDSDQYYKFATKVGPPVAPNYILNPEETSVDFEITTTEEFLEVLEKINTYSEEIEGAPHNATFLRGGEALASDRESSLARSWSDSIPNIDFDMPRVIVESLVFFDEDTYQIRYPKEGIYLITSKSGDVVFSEGVKKLICPPFYSPEFAQHYDHEKYFEIDRDEFLTEVSAILPFANSAHSLALIVEDEDDKLMLKVEEEAEHVSRSISKVTRSNGPIPKMKFSGGKMKKILTHFPEESMIRIQYEEEKPALNMTSEQSDFQVIQSRMSL